MNDRMRWSRLGRAFFVITAMTSWLFLRHNPMAVMVMLAMVVAAFMLVVWRVMASVRARSREDVVGFSVVAVVCAGLMLFLAYRLQEVSAGPD